MAGDAKVLIIDDEPAHLKLYSWILEREGFQTTTALVDQRGVHLPPRDLEFDVTLLDYRLRTGIKAVDVARKVRDLWPGTRILVLSDMMWLPEDIAPIADGFIRKGEPQLLVDKLTEMTRQEQGPASGSA
jgi:DNA-binding response OmpR family regulator